MPPSCQQNLCICFVFVLFPYKISLFSVQSDCDKYLKFTFCKSCFSFSGMLYILYVEL